MVLVVAYAHNARISLFPALMFLISDGKHEKFIRNVVFFGMFVSLTMVNENFNLFASVLCEFSQKERKKSAAASLPYESLPINYTSLQSIIATHIAYESILSDFILMRSY